MASILTSQAVVLATAMAAGTVLLIALRLQKSLPTVDPIPQSPPRATRSSILSDGKRVSGNQKNKEKKKVHFAVDVVDPTGYSDEFKRQHGIVLNKSSSTTSNKQQKFKVRSMPANRVALYNGILRDRVGHRLAYSY